MYLTKQWEWKIWRKKNKLEKKYKEILKSERKKINWNSLKMLKILTFGRGKTLKTVTTRQFILKVTFFVFEVLQYVFHHVQSFAFYLKPALLNRFSSAGLRLPPSFIRLYNSTARNFSQRKRCFHSSHVLIAPPATIFIYRNNLVRRLQRWSTFPPPHPCPLFAVSLILFSCLRPFFLGWLLSNLYGCVQTRRRKYFNYNMKSGIRFDDEGLNWTVANTM